jgi:hypothetical protein
MWRRWKKAIVDGMLIGKESVRIMYQRRIVDVKGQWNAGGWRSILLRLAWRLACGETGFLKGPPFEVLLVASAGDAPSCALLAGGLSLVALEALRFARYTSIAALGLLPLGDAVGVRRFGLILRRSLLRPAGGLLGRRLRSWAGVR